jgi:tripartite-type tricarboxylate transporter receptor subunit TctC
VSLDEAAIRACSRTWNAPVMPLFRTGRLAEIGECFYNGSAQGKTKMTISVRVFSKLSLAASLLVSGAVAAQAWPEKPIRLVIPFAVGGVVDYMGRELAQALSAELGKPVIVENKGGAAGVIGVDQVAKSPPDGYTLSFANGGAIAIVPHVQKSMPYDALKDLIPVSPVASVANVLVVPASHPARDLKQLIEIAKKDPNKLTYGSAGMGASDHMATLQFMNMAGIVMTGVPYKGGGPAIIDLLAGNIDLIISTFPPAIGHIKTGRLRALGVTSTSRLEILPDAPTIAEAGVPGYASDAWYGIFSPARTPEDITQRINAATRKILETNPGFRKRLVESAATPMIQTPSEYKAFVQQEYDKWQKLLQASGERSK